MPIYEYACSDCGKHFEIFQKMSDDPLTKCKICGGKVNRLISQCSFQLKGSGWYATDYKRGGATSAGNGTKAAKEETSGSTTDSTSTAKSEAPGGST
jgi:putative FmdB family regulatory protein